jgi:hypothetical protein
VLSASSSSLRFSAPLILRLVVVVNGGCGTTVSGSAFFWPSFSAVFCVFL